jgi:hypothetical protein
LSFELFKSSDGFCRPIGFHSSEVMRPHPEWPGGDQIGGDCSRPQSILSLAGLRSFHELGRGHAASAALFLMEPGSRDENRLVMTDGSMSAAAVAGRATRNDPRTT